MSDKDIEKDIEDAEFTEVSSDEFLEVTKSSLKTSETETMVTVMVFLKEGVPPYFLKSISLQDYKRIQTALHSNSRAPDAFLSLQDETGSNIIPVSNIGMITMQTDQNIRALELKAQEEHRKRDIRNTLQTNFESSSGLKTVN